MGATAEGEQVVFAHAVELDVADKHDFVVIFCENPLEMDARVGVQAGENLGIHACHTGRSLQKTFSVWVFADSDQDLSNGSLDALSIHVEFLV